MPDLNDFVYISDSAYSKDEILEMEYKIHFTPSGLGMYKSKKKTFFVPQCCKYPNCVINCTFQQMVMILHFYNNVTILFLTFNRLS